MVNLTNETSQNNTDLVQDSTISPIASVNSFSKLSLSSSDTISLVIGIFSIFIALLSLIVTCRALLYAKREFIDKRKEVRRKKAQERSKVIMNRMAQEDE